MPPHLRILAARRAGRALVVAVTCAAVAGYGLSPSFAATVTPATTGATLTPATTGTTIAPATTGTTAAPATTGATAAPTGTIASVARDHYGIEVRGVAVVPGDTAAAVVYVALDGARKATITANLAHGGARDGYDAVLSGVAEGAHQVCVSVLAYPSATAVRALGCRAITLDYDPIGALGAMTPSNGTLTVTGWAFDPDFPVRTTSAQILIDRRLVATATADQRFPNLGRAYPAAGDDHGFTATVPITAGTHQVCAVVRNLGYGNARALPCASDTVSFSPTGAITSITRTPGGVRVAGWARDPDTSAPTSVTVLADGKTLGTAVADQATNNPTTGHVFRQAFALGARALKPRPRVICVIAENLGTLGNDSQLGCRTVTFSWNPTGGLDSLAQRSPGGGALVTGWGIDPDTTSPVSVLISERTAAGLTTLATVLANGAGSHAGHSFSHAVRLTNGTHTICVSTINVDYGNGDSTPACGSVTLALEPFGKFESVSRARTTGDVVATGWAIDPDTVAAIWVRVSIDGGRSTAAKAGVTRPDIAAGHPGFGAAHGFVIDVPTAGAGEHQVCVAAVNAFGGTGTTKFGCKIVDAVHPRVASAPTRVRAIGGYGGAQIAWTAPARDGGAPWTGYTVRARPNGPSTTVGPTRLSATLLGLRSSARYTFSVVADNVAGMSAPGVSAVVTTQRQPPAQHSPAPISTSRYVRNVLGASAADLATMRAEGASDARRDPSGHGYLVLLDLGGQDESRQGLILTAGIRFVSYADMVADLRAYVAGYASQQRASAPVTVALATNNDIDVDHASGASFATHIVDPIAGYAARYPGITVAGSDDMEPGFSASYAQTRSWLQGFIATTRAPFVFTGSADGCAYSYANGSCNNGWTAAGLYYLAGGAEPIKMMSLPQIYNFTMAEQWRYISLTGVDARHPKIDFGGGLTEYTACAQAGSCGSLTARTAWTYLWGQLRAEPRLAPTSLPYSTDLRIDS